MGEGGFDVFKKLKGESKRRLAQQQYKQQRAASMGAGAGTPAATAAPAGASQPPAPQPKQYEPLHKYFVSQNWKTLLDRKPKVSPKAAAANSTAGGPDGRAAYDIVAIDCEMVGVGTGGVRSVLARVSIVDSEGNVLMDRFVQPEEEVTDYRTFVTGITAERLQRRDVFTEKAAIKKAAEMMKGKIIVGHALNNDFQVLQIEHDHALIRDTARFRALRLPEGKKTPSLKKLASYWLQETIQEGSHDSVQDARTALRLYRLKSRIWEKQMRSAMVHLDDEVGAASEEEGEPVQRAPSSKPSGRERPPPTGSRSLKAEMKKEEKAEKKAESRQRQNQHAKDRKSKRARQKTGGASGVAKKGKKRK